MISPVLTINAPMANKSINAIPTLPTSPAKHFALPLGLKLKNENTITANKMISRKDVSTKLYVLLTSKSGKSTAAE